MNLLRFSNAEIIGRLKLDTIRPYSLQNIKCVVLKPSTEYNEYYTFDTVLTAGKIVNNTFDECEVTFFYVTICKIHIDIISNPNQVYSNTVRITCPFSVKDKNNVKVEHNVIWETAVYVTRSASELVGMINAINRFVENGGSASNLNWNELINVARCLYPQSAPKNNIHRTIINIVDRLEIRSFQDSLSRVGRDNTFWNETYISNLPNNIYHRKLLYDSLANLFPNIDNIRYETTGSIYIESDRESYYGNATERHEISGVFQNELKEMLKIEIALNYNSEKEEFYILNRLYKV